MADDRPATFAELLRAATRERGERTFLPRRHGRGGAPTTFGELAREVDRLAAGLAARGLVRGDRIGLISENRAEWLIADLACASIGLVDVPRGTDTSPLEMLFILRHAGCRFVLAETAEAARAILELADELPQVEGVGVLEPGAEVDGAVPLEQLQAQGDAALAADPARLDPLRAAVEPDDLLTIVYTSGTTAEPKGVMLLHRNVLCNIEAVRDVLHIDADDVFLSVLPAWHAYERILDYVALRVGAQLVYTDRRRIKDDLREVRPTVFGAVPRIWESIHDGVVTACRKRRGLAGRLLGSVIEASHRVGRGDPTLWHRAVHGIARLCVLPKFRAATGGRLRLAVSGGGALPPHVDATLLGIGVPVLNGYGLTETSPVVAVRTPEDNRPGTIGRPLPDTEVEIREPGGRALAAGETGIVWIRGPQVMAGYYENPERTSSVLRDGWFDSGDLGHVEPDGHLRITGRAKDTIVLAGGENVEPEHLEAALKTSAYIQQAVVLGQDKKQLGAILVAELECLELAVPRDAWREVDGVLTGDVVKRFFRDELDRVLSMQNGFRPLERIATFRVLTEPMTIENGLLTQTLKVKRHKVHEHHGELIAQMW